MLRAGTTTFEAKSGYGLDRDTELAQLRAIRTAGGIPTWLGAHTVPPEFADAGADAYVDFLVEEVLPEAAQLAEAADVFLERGAFDADQARRYLEACRAAGLALRLHGDQFTESGAIPLAIELGARSVDHLEATGSTGIAALAASDVTGVLLPASALFLGRPMPPARALVDAGRSDRARDRLQPRERVLREPPARLLTRRDADGSSHRRRRSLRARSTQPTCSHAPITRADSPQGTTRTSSSSTPTTGVISRTTSAARWSTPSFEAGGSPGAAGHNRSMATKKQRRRRAKEQRHDYVWVDAEGNELDPEEAAAAEKRAARQRPRARVATRRLLRGSGPSSAARSSRRSCWPPCSCSRPTCRSSQKLTQTLLIVAIFVPFSYFLDRFFYRSFQRRAERREQSNGRRGS